MDNSKELFELMTKMYSEMQDMKQELKDDIKGVDSKIDVLEIKIDKRFDGLTSDIGNLVTNDIAEGISNQIEDVKSDIKFLTHKTQETEKDVYKIQHHLKIVK